MRVLSQNELVQLAGGLHTHLEDEASQAFVMGAGIGAIFSAILLESNIIGTLTGAVLIGMLFSRLVAVDYWAEN